MSNGNMIAQRSVTLLLALGSDEGIAVVTPRDFLDALDQEGADGSQE